MNARSKFARRTPDLNFNREARLPLNDRHRCFSFSVNE